MTAPEFFREKLSELFDAYRVTGGTQSSLAAQTGLKQSQVSTWLKGGYLPSYEALLVLASFFDVPISEFFPAEAMCPQDNGKSPSPKKLAAIRAIILALPALDEDKLGSIRERVLGELEVIKRRALKADSTDGAVNLRGKIK